MDTPLVFTTKGMLPIDELEYFHRWEDTPEYTKFIEGYKLNGEVIKQAAHVMIKQGQGIGVELDDSLARVAALDLLEEIK